MTNSDAVSPAALHSGLILFVHELGHFADEHGQLRLHDVPYKAVIDLRIGMNKNVAEGDDAAEVSDPLGESGVHAGLLEIFLAA